MNTLNLRIIHTHDIESNWNNCADFVPKSGELIVYDADKDSSYARVKIGDGIHTVSELPFCIDSAVLRLLNFTNNTAHLDAGRITDYVVQEK